MLVRLLHKNHYDFNDGRFKSLAFRPSSTGGGLSVVSNDCAVRKSGDICSHIRKFYGNTRIVSDPPIFWAFLKEILQIEVRVVMEDGESGDECHCNVYGVTQQQAKQFFKAFQKRHGITNFSFCDPKVGLRSLAVEDLKS